MKSSVKELSVQKLQGNPSLGMKWKKTVLLWNILEINDSWAEEDRNLSPCCQRRVWRPHQCSSPAQVQVWVTRRRRTVRTHQSIHGKVFKLVTHQYFSNRINSYCTIKFRLWAPTDELCKHLHIFLSSISPGHHRLEMIFFATIIVMLENYVFIHF